MPWHTVVRGEYLRREQPVVTVATHMPHIDVGQFAEPVPDSRHDRLLL
jgi:hypothetical protein